MMRDLLLRIRALCRRAAVDREIDEELRFHIDQFGIRMALGALPAGVVRRVVTRVAALVGIGAVLGAAASVWLSRFVATLLYGLEPGDPVTLVEAVIILRGSRCAGGVIPGEAGDADRSRGGVARELKLYRFPRLRGRDCCSSDKRPKVRLWQLHAQQTGVPRLCYELAWWPPHVQWLRWSLVSRGRTGRLRLLKQTCARSAW